RASPRQASRHPMKNDPDPSQPNSSHRSGAHSYRARLAAAMRMTARKLAARRGRVGLLAVVTAAVIVGGTLAAVLGARSVASSEVQKARLAFHSSSQEIAAALKLAIQHEEDLVMAASAYVTSNPDATPAQFDRWATAVQAMRRYRELENIGLVKLVGAGEVPLFERY